MAIERHQHDLVGRLADDGIEQFGELSIVPKLRGGGPARLHEHHDSEGAIPGLFERHLLPGSVVEELHLTGSQIAKKLARGKPDQRRGNDQGGGSSDSRGSFPAGALGVPHKQSRGQDDHAFAHSS
jgi:hypothetical protein